MIKVLILLAFTGVAIILGPLLADSQGFVHIATNSTIIETSITTAVIIYILSIVFLFVLYTVTKKIYNLPIGTLKAFKHRALKKKKTLQDEAVIYFEQGQYENALALLKHTAPIEKMTENALLVAAQCAFHIGLYDYTRQALDEASSRGKSAKIASEIVRAKLNLNIGNEQAALENLDNIKSDIKNKAVLEMYYDCYKRTGKLSKILEISKDLVKFKVLSAEQVHEIYLQNIHTMLSDASTIEDLDRIYKQLSKNDKKDQTIMGAMVFKMLKLGDINRAREISLSLLKLEHTASFLETISNWEIAIPDVLIALKKHAAKNLITTQVNLPLLKAMGNLEHKSGLLRDALADYKQALSIQQSSDLYLKVGSILASLQNYPEATEYFARANQLSSEENSLKLTN